MEGVSVRFLDIEYRVLLEKYISPQQRVRSAVSKLWEIYLSFPDVLRPRMKRFYFSDEVYGMLVDMANESELSKTSIIKAALVLYLDSTVIGMYNHKLKDIRRL